VGSGVLPAEQHLASGNLPVFISVEKIKAPVRLPGSLKKDNGHALFSTKQDRLAASIAITGFLFYHA
jgi:hypothetical protein